MYSSDPGVAASVEKFCAGGCGAPPPSSGETRDQADDRREERRAAFLNKKPAKGAESNARAKSEGYAIKPYSAETEGFIAVPPPGRFPYPGRFGRGSECATGYGHPGSRRTPLCGRVQRTPLCGGALGSTGSLARSIGRATPFELREVGALRTGNLLAPSPLARASPRCASPGIAYGFADYIRPVPARGSGWAYYKVGEYGYRLAVRVTADRKRVKAALAVACAGRCPRGFVLRGDTYVPTGLGPSGRAFVARGGAGPSGSRL
jgi:hypothetical protein